MVKVYEDYTWLPGTDLWVSAQHLEVLGAGAGAYGQREGVVKLVDDEVQVHCLLPVHIRVTNGQLATVSPIHLHLSLGRSSLSLVIQWVYLHNNKLIYLYQEEDQDISKT